jgi:hypothetical protein
MEKTMTTVKQEIERLFLESKKHPHIVQTYFEYYYALLDHSDLTLDEFYKLYPQYDVEKTDSLYWKQFMQQWKEIWIEKN